jgi:lipopolysaccharide assembly protein A
MTGPGNDDPSRLPADAAFPREVCAHDIRATAGRPCRCWYPSSTSGSEPDSGGAARPRRTANARGGVWVAVAFFALILVLLLIFILENTQRVDISYFGVHGHSTLGVALLLAAVLGVLLVAIPATWRIIQLRAAARRQRRSAAK